MTAQEALHAERRRSVLAALQRRERSRTPYGGVSETVCFPTPTMAQLAGETGYSIAIVDRALGELDGVEIMRRPRKEWGAQGRRDIVFVKRAVEPFVLACGCTITESHRAHAEGCSDSWWGVPVYP